ncbi:sensor histidine kinase [Paenibacillus chungangensis]|uniref:Sensor histidine kinase n=1 Tax=Paenibacillus chungangensis TaxID=696535 RepID=A0ABW3HW34_9BACL
MKLKMNTFTKILFIIIPLLLFVSFMYSFSHQRSVVFIREELTKTSQDRSAFFLYQIDTTMDQITTSSISLSRDPTVLELMNLYLYKTYYDQAMIQNNLMSKLIVQQSSTNWSSSVSLFFPELKTVVSTDSTIGSYEENKWSENYALNWMYREVDDRGQFYRHIGYPYLGEDRGAQVIVETSVDALNLSNLLSQLKTEGKGEHFLTDGSRVISSLMPDRAHIQAVMSQLVIPSEEQGYTTISIDSDDYIVSYDKSNTLGWYLISSIPLSEILNPIVADQKLFYGFMSMFFVLGAAAVALLYRNVQLPMRRLIRSTLKATKEELRTLSAADSVNEFQLLNRNFEMMATSVSDLSDKVYVETIRSREATLKQLQSQIDPHFLYNSLSFIINMTKLKQDKEVIAMAHHLSDYFRYTTRVNNQMPTVREEIQLISHYLEIQSMRNKKLKYEIDIPESMLSLQLPRLIVQPLVENAIIHGIEQRIGSCCIRIVGESLNDEHSIAVEDDGVQVTEEELLVIVRKMNAVSASEASGGCGLQNVNMRMKLRLGDEAGVRLEATGSVGIRATLYWRVEHVPDSDRG